MKQPDWKLPLVLSGTLLVFGTFSYWLRYSHKPKKEKEETATKKPLALPNENTQISYFKMKSSRLLIEGKCEELAAKKCSLASTDGKWTITHPQSVKGDNDSIKEFLNAAANALATETIDLGEETPEKRKQLLDEYGLSDQKRTDISTQFIEFVLEDGKKITMWFGADHPLGEKTFVARAVNGTIEDKNIYLISNFFKNNFDHGLTYFRDKKIFSFSKEQIDAFEAKTTLAKLDGKKANGLWTINDYPGDSDRIQNFLIALSQVKAKEFPDTDPIKGMKPVDDFTLHVGKETSTLALYEKKEAPPKGSKQAGKSTFYVKSSARPEIMEVESIFETQVRKKLADLRQGSLLTQTEKVTATQLNVEGKNFKAPLSFKYEAAKWALKTPGLKLDEAKVTKLMDQLVNSRVVDYVKPPAGKKDQIHLTAGDDKNPTKFNMIFYTANDRAYAEDQNTKDKQAKLLDPELKTALPFTEDSWKIK